VKPEIEQFLDEVATKATGAGQVGQAESIRELRAPREAQAARVVVAGETKRGKSSLVNALVHEADLLPVDVDVATGCLIVLGYAASTRAVVFSQGAPDGISIETSALSDYASVSGNPGNRKGVTHINIGLPAPILGEGLALIDTPGVGGLESGHTDLTVATLRRADALLYVLDSSAPMNAREASFLRKASENVATILFVMTKIDLQAASDELASSNAGLIRSILGEHVDAPIPCSSEMFRRSISLSQHDPELADALAVESNIPTVEESLRQHVIGRVDGLSTQNALRVASVTIERLLADLGEAIRSYEHDEELGRQIADERSRCEALAAPKAAWRFQLGTKFQQLNLDVQARLATSCVELGRRHEQQLSTTGPLATMDEILAVLQS